MSSTTVAPIEGYIFTSELSAPDNHAQINAQEKVSFQLTDNNLWLVDISKLRSTTLMDSFSYIAEDQIQKTEYQLNVPFANIDDTAEPITLPKASTNLPAEWSSLSLSTDTSLQLALFKGSVELPSFSSSVPQTSSTLLQSSSQSLSSTSSTSGSEIGGSLPGVPSGPPQSSTPPPTPVPFDFAPSLGMIIVVAFWGFNSFLRGKIFHPVWIKSRNVN